MYSGEYDVCGVTLSNTLISTELDSVPKYTKSNRLDLIAQFV